MSFQNKLNFIDFRNFIESLRARKQDFEITSTSYTKSVKWKGATFSFVNEVGSSIVFACYNKIKKDIQSRNIVIDFVPRFDINFYSVNNYLTHSGLRLPTEVLNVDINSAYITTLLTTGFISKETFDFISSKDKLTRLRSVGMLAMQKIKMTFIGGEMLPVTADSITCDKELRNVYFYTCFKVGEVMTEVSEQLGNDFLFYWVDGIYTEPHVRASHIVDTLKKHGYESKFKTLYGCTFENRNKLLYFAHKESEDDKVKRFVVPYNDAENKRRINQYINSLKQPLRNESNFISVKEGTTIENEF